MYNYKSSIHLYPLGNAAHLWHNSFKNVFHLNILMNIFYLRQGFKANPRCLSYSKAFSGGLFLAVGVIHLLPEVLIN